MLRLPEKALSQPFPPAQAGASGPQGRFREMGRPLRKASFRKPPRRCGSDFAQKGFGRTPLPEWLCAMFFPLTMCLTGQGCHYLHFTGEDTEGERMTCLKQEGQERQGWDLNPGHFRQEEGPANLRAREVIWRPRGRRRRASGGGYLPESYQEAKVMQEAGLESFHHPLSVPSVAPHYL